MTLSLINLVAVAWDTQKKCQRKRAISGGCLYRDGAGGGMPDPDRCVGCIVFRVSGLLFFYFISLVGKCPAATVTPANIVRPFRASRMFLTKAWLAGKGDFLAKRLKAGQGLLKPSTN